VSKPFFCRRNQAADLLHQGQEIADAPMICDLSVLYSYGIWPGGAWTE
jgi:hypothetical protein